MGCRLSKGIFPPFTPVLISKLQPKSRPQSAVLTKSARKDSSIDTGISKAKRQQIEKGISPPYISGLEYSDYPLSNLAHELKKKRMKEEFLAGIGHKSTSKRSWTNPTPSFKSQKYLQLHQPDTDDVQRRGVK